MRRLIAWLYWRFNCYTEDEHNRRLALIVVQNEPTPEAAAVIVTRANRWLSGGQFDLEGIKIYSGRAKRVV